MSYQIGVVVKDGVAEIDPGHTSLPADGSYVINGHVPAPGTWNAEHIQVTRADASGNAVIQASGTYYPPPA